MNWYTGVMNAYKSCKIDDENKNISGMSTMGENPF